MAELNKKIFLDEAGLKLYDELLRAYINQENDKNNASVSEVIASLAALSASVTADEAKIQENADALAVLMGDGEGSIQKAIADLVDGAPEALDTLKELADWVAGDDTGSAALINRVVANEEEIANLKSENESLKSYIDAQDEMVYNSIQPIEALKIKSLFPVSQGEATAVEAIGNLAEGEALALNENQLIEEDLVISKSCYIDANGSTFEGTVTVPADVDVVIENATFAKPVVVA